jgi:hypothetical protein
MTTNKAKRTTRTSLQPDAPRRLIKPRTKWARAFDKWLRDFAERNNLRTMAEVAERLGFSRDWILAVRRGDKVPGPIARRELERWMRGEIV